MSAANVAAPPQAQRWPKSSLPHKNTGVTRRKRLGGKASGLRLGSARRRLACGHKLRWLRSTSAPRDAPITRTLSSLKPERKRVFFQGSTRRQGGGQRDSGDRCFFTPL